MAEPPRQRRPRGKSGGADGPGASPGDRQPEATGGGGRLRRLLPRPPLRGMLLRALALLLSLAGAIRYPSLAIVAVTVWLWVLGPPAMRRRRWAAPAPAADPNARQHSLALRYLGGHPCLPRAGAARLTVWPDDGAAELRVGRHAAAFPLAAVQSVRLVEGRVHLHTGTRGRLAAAVGRLLCAGSGKFCGLKRQGDEDLAVVDRSRVLCDLVRQGRPCRVVLTGPGGGGEEVYLETLVLLRPLASWREPGPAGGSTGAATSPPQVG